MEPRHLNWKILETVGNEDATDRVEKNMVLTLRFTWMLAFFGGAVGSLAQDGPTGQAARCGQ